eukprot:164679-Lingulodinium_polyedra.AAC.1
MWGARVVRQCRRTEYVLPWEAHADARPGVGGRCLGMEFRVINGASRNPSETHFTVAGCPDSCPEFQ